ncbi:hypothetical protein [Ralstonia pseudosolanacearum]|uniref:hypothetical protein n=1 Tax=Ralstonia pseudosolanacearum TaxID=1310165 RepID=UPI0011B84573|nr:hypothetical protein [Ralstonia pseudosolanacearum]MCK4155511.1 hypothetical protein [Ralstonia pseudosolanacearum]
MEKFFRFIGRYFVDLAALTMSLMVFLIGIRLAWTNNPAWANRAGALITIIGVLLAASRFHEWIKVVANNFVDRNIDGASAFVMDYIKIEHGKDISGDTLNNLRSYVKSELKEMIASLIEDDKKRFKLYELYLVIFGTFLNGFGDYLICLAKI